MSECKRAANLAVRDGLHAYDSATDGAADGYILKDNHRTLRAMKMMIGAAPIEKVATYGLGDGGDEKYATSNRHVPCGDFRQAFCMDRAQEASNF